MKKGLLNSVVFRTNTGRILFVIWIIFIFCGSVQQIKAQKYDRVWTFGYSDTNPSIPPNGGFNLVFNATEPVVQFIDHEIDYYFTAASICDIYGNLLFQTNGCFLAGADNQALPNGGDLTPGFFNDLLCPDYYPAQKGVFFLPYPTDTNQYFLFHSGVAPLNDSMGSAGAVFYYSTLDKNLNGGMGDVVLKDQVILEDTLAWGQIAANRHGNGRDWWIVVPEFSTFRHYIYLFDPAGIHLVHIQSIGGIHLSDSGSGCAVFSPDGALYARFDLYNGLHVFNFDRCSGWLSPPPPSFCTARFASGAI